MKFSASFKHFGGYLKTDEQVRVLIKKTTGSRCERGGEGTSRGAERFGREGGMLGWMEEEGFFLRGVGNFIYRSRRSGLD